MHASSCLSRSSFAGFTIARTPAFVSPALYRLDMRLPRTMATLAVDALGKCVAEPRAASRHLRRAHVGSRCDTTCTPHR